MTIKTYDAIIIGGGPAGAQCALWLKMLGYNPLILEKADRLGGLQNQSPYQNDWIVCLPKKTGMEVASLIQENISHHDIDFIINIKDLAIKKAGDEFVISFNNKNIPETLAGRKLVIATGVQHKDGGFKSSEKILIGSGNIIDSYNFKNKKVAILGGGDTAVENYQFIKNNGANAVKVFARTLRARPALYNAVPKENIIIGNFVANENHMEINSEKFDIFCVMFGWEPVNPLKDYITLDMNENGFIQTDNFYRTSDPDIFAIGECTQKVHPCVVTAMADGVIAAKAIQNDFEA